MARVKRSADKSHVEWTTRKLIEQVKDKLVDFEIDIQRGYVWKSNEQKSAFIQSLILDDFVPPLYFNKLDDVYEGIDGKQKTLTVAKYVNDEFELSGVVDIPIINDDGEMEYLDINGYRFSDLPECIKNAIMEFNFSICFKINADQEEVGRNFYNLNNGTKINAACMNRLKAKSKTQIIELSKHKLFKESLTKVALEGHVNDDLVGRSHAILNSEAPEMGAVWIRKYLKEVDITEDDMKELNQIFDRIYNVHSIIAKEDNKTAKRIYVRTHMISIVPIIKLSIEENRSENDMARWFMQFYCGKKAASISQIYNMAAGSGSGRRDAVRKRLEEIEKNYIKYFDKKDKGE